MDQHEDKKRNMLWYDWLVFLIPAIFIVTLGLESALGAKDAEYRDFRAVAHWFDPVFFQYNLVMTLLVVLVVPSLALSYTLTMANRKERRLQHEVPPERRGEIRRRMGRRASFGTYRGSVWLTTIVVMLGASILLLFKPVSSATGVGADFSLGANMLTMGPFAELYETNPDAYYSHFIRNQIAFQFGWLGAYVYFIGSVVRAYFTMDLTSHTFVDGAIRMIVASILALVLSFAFDFFLPGELELGSTSATAHVHNSTESSTATESSPGAGALTATGEEAPGRASSEVKNTRNGDSEGTVVTLPQNLSLLPIVAFFLGFYPKRAAMGIDRLVVKITRNIIPGNSYRALPLSMLAGMSYSHELRLEREGFDNVENLSTADAVDLAIRTCFSYVQLKQWIDQAWLAAHLREDYPEFVHRTGIASSKELELFLSTCDSAKVAGVEQLAAALAADPAASASWKLRLTAIKILLDISPVPAGNCRQLGENEDLSG